LPFLRPLDILGQWVRLVILRRKVARPTDATTFTGLDANDAPDPAGKAAVLRKGRVQLPRQAAQRGNLDSTINAFEVAGGDRLLRFATAHQGIVSGDNNRFRRKFWEKHCISYGWELLQSTVGETTAYAGCEDIIWWDGDGRHIARAQGTAAWGKAGIAINVVRSLACSLYVGSPFSDTLSVVVPRDSNNLCAIFSFIADVEYPNAVRRIDQALSVTDSSFTKVPFDLAHWQKIAAEKYPNGLPEPYSDDPTQWLFHGHPAQADKGTALHVALARLCGYRWPAESDEKMRLSREAREWIGRAAALPQGDDDGPLALPAVAGERPLAERLRVYLAAAFGPEWSDSLERRLVTEADDALDKRSARDPTLEAWLCDRAFRQHCALFKNRPFLWHIWDGQRDGFAALLHYHRLDRANLEKLTFSLLGDWIARMRDAGDGRRLEAARILQEKLQAILAGEDPLDIFVRWKPLAAQPAGWEPDLDDGVRLNIRPFMQAQILRDALNIHWRKDRGRDAPSAPWYEKFGGERINDYHLRLADKAGARAAAE
jgi:hypothetical protein